MKTEEASSGSRRRVFVAALAHETNSFSPLPTSLRSFEDGLRHHAGDLSTLGKACQFPGFGDALEVVREFCDEAIDGMCAWAEPAGPISKQGYEVLREELLQSLRAAGTVDMVFLVLHGAMIAEGYPD